MAVAVAILAGGGFGPARTDGAAMVGIEVNLGFHPVAFGAGDRGQFVRVGKIFGVLMARDAEVSAVNGGRKSFGVDKGSVGPLLPVAHQTIVVAIRGRRRGEK